MAERIRKTFVLKEIAKEGKDTIFLNEDVQIEDLKTQILYKEYAEKIKKSGTYGDYINAGVLVFEDQEYLVYEKEGNNGGTYLSATIEKGEVFANVNKKQPLSYKYSSDPKLKEQFTMEVTIVYNEGKFKKEEENTDLPF